MVDLTIELKGDNKRFEKIGLEMAKTYNIRQTNEFIKFCQIYSYLWFVAECSDDYNRTLLEQKQLNKDLEDYINAHNM